MQLMVLNHDQSHTQPKSKTKNSIKLYESSCNPHF